MDCEVGWQLQQQQNHDLVPARLQHQRLPAHTSIHQGSPLSPNLLLFYNAHLINICNSTTILASWIALDDGVNALACGDSTYENCRTLLIVYIWCLECTQKHWALFAPEKYIPVHFTKAKTKYNTSFPATYANCYNAPQPLWTCSGRHS